MTKPYTPYASIILHRKPTNTGRAARAEWLACKEWGLCFLAQLIMSLSLPA